MSEAVASVLQVTPTDDFRTCCYLPRKFAGLGLTRQDDTATEKSQILSRLALFDFLAKHHPHEFQLISIHLNRTEIQLGQQEALQDHTGLNEETMLTLTSPSARNILTAAKTLAYKKQSEDLHSLLVYYPISQQHAAWLLSSTDSSTNFIHSSIRLGSEGNFSADEFRCVTRAKLGFGPTNDPLGLIRVCACSKSFDAAEDSLHALSC